MHVSRYDSLIFEALDRLMPHQPHNLSTVHLQSIVTYFRHRSTDFPSGWEKRLVRRLRVLVSLGRLCEERSRGIRFGLDKDAKSLLTQVKEEFKENETVVDLDEDANSSLVYEAAAKRITASLNEPRRKRRLSDTGVSENAQPASRNHRRKTVAGTRAIDLDAEPTKKARHATTTTGRTRLTAYVRTQLDRIAALEQELLHVRMERDKYGRELRVEERDMRRQSFWASVEEAKKMRDYDTRRRTVTDVELGRDFDHDDTTWNPVDYSLVLTTNQNDRQGMLDTMDITVDGHSEDEDNWEDAVDHFGNFNDADMERWMDESTPEVKAEVPDSTLMLEETTAEVERLRHELAEQTEREQQMSEAFVIAKAREAYIQERMKRFEGLLTRVADGKMFAHDEHEAAGPVIKFARRILKRIEEASSDEASRSIGDDNDEIYGDQGIEELQMELDVMREARASMMKNMMEQYESKLARQEESIAELNHKLHEKEGVWKKEKKEFQRAIADMTQAHEALVAQDKEKQDVIAQLASDVEHTRQQSMDKEQQHQQTVQQAQISIDGLQAELAAQKQLLAATTAEAQSLHTMLTDIQHKHGEAEQRWASEKDAFVQQADQLHQLEAQFAQLQVDYEEVASQAAVLETERQRSHQQIDQHTNTIAQHAADLEQVRASLATANQHIEQLKKEIARLHNHSDTQRDQVDHLNKELDNAKHVMHFVRTGLKETRQTELRLVNSIDEVLFQQQLEQDSVLPKHPAMTPSSSQIDFYQVENMPINGEKLI
jgi:uncharacterized coiled-coil protein SlyX